MNKNVPGKLGLVLLMGSVWGLSEAVLGIWLHRCAHMASGSVMTGVALFFLAAGYALTRRGWTILLMVGVAALFRMFDAVLLSRPIFHESVVNPVFGFFIEGVFFALLIYFLGNRLMKGKKGQAMLGGGTALAAGGAFPLVGSVTGYAACAYPGTAIPLSVVFSPVAIILSMVTVPLGFWVGERLTVWLENKNAAYSFWFNRLVSPTAAALCVLLLAAIRRF